MSSAEPEGGKPAPHPARHAAAWPLWLHAAALAAVLVVLMIVVGPARSYSADEGAAIIQAQSLAAGEGWLVEHPFPEADPTGRRYPLELSEWGEDGIAPYAKPPAYPAVLAAADRLGGIEAMVALSMSGTVAAAVAAALLAGRIAPEAAATTLWVVGVGSPLVFDAFLVMAHTLGAAACGFAVLAALRAAERAQLRWSLVAMACVMAAAALRTEAVLVGAAIAGAGLWLALRQRSWPWAATAAASLVAIGIVRFAEGTARHAIVGDVRARPQFGSDDGGAGLLADRWTAFVQTWLRPDAGGQGSAVVLMALALTLAVVAVVALRPPGLDAAVGRVAAVGAAGLLLVRAVMVTPEAVPGLLAAFPLLWIGLLLAGRRLFERPTASFLAAVGALGAAAVLATQYREGGSAEWGGRYFAVLVPVVAPVAVVGVLRAGRSLDRPLRRIVGASLAVGTLSLSVVAVRELRAAHADADRALDAIDAAASTLEEPVIVSTYPAMPRFAWATFDEQRWLLVDPSDDALVEDLARAGIDRFVLVSDDLEAHRTALGPLVRVPGTPGTPGIAVVERRPAPNARSLVVTDR